MGCVIAIIGILVVLVGIYLTALAHSFSEEDAMIWGIVVAVLGVILFTGGWIFDIFSKNRKLRIAISIGVLAVGLILGLIGWTTFLYSGMIGTIVFLLLSLFGIIALRISLGNKEKS